MFHFIIAEHGPFVKGVIYLWERKLLHQAANGLGVSGGIIHGQALDQLCLCIEQAAVFLDLVGITGLLCGLQHGECVALGMLPMIESKALQKRVRAVYRRIGLPTRTTYNKEKVLAEMLHDKKAQGGQITVIKVPGLGCWRAETIPVEGLRPLLGVEE